MYLLNEDHKMFIEQVRRMVKEKVEPRAADIDAKAEFPWDIKEVFQEMGLLGLAVPEEYGGCNQGHLFTCLAVEEIAKACVSSSLIVQVQALGWEPILIGGIVSVMSMLSFPFGPHWRQGSIAIGLDRSA